MGTIVGRVCTLLGEGPTFLEALADPERCAARSLAMRRWGRSSFARHHPHILRDPGLVKSWDRDGRSLSTRWRCEAGLQRGCCRATWVQGATYREAFADAQRSLETGSDTAAD